MNNLRAIVIIINKLPNDVAYYVVVICDFDHMLKFSPCILFEILNTQKT